MFLFLYTAQRSECLFDHEKVDLTAYVEKHEFCFDAVLDEHVTNDEVRHLLSKIKLYCCFLIWRTCFSCLDIIYWPLCYRWYLRFMEVNACLYLGVDLFDLRYDCLFVLYNRYTELQLNQLFLQFFSEPKLPVLLMVRQVRNFLFAIDIIPIPNFSANKEGGIVVFLSFYFYFFGCVMFLAGMCNIGQYI